MIIVFDLDDTLCDTDKHSEKYMLKFFKQHKLPYKQVAKNVRFAEQKFDWDTETAIEWYKTYGDEMMLKFPISKSMVKLINKLYNANNKIIIATARANDWHTDPEGVTLSWLKNNGIKYHKIYIGRLDKEKICETENADIFIDDDIKITSRVAEYFKTLNQPNKKVYLTTTGYNRTLPTPQGVERVKSVKKFLKSVNKMSK